MEKLRINEAIAMTVVNGRSVTKKAISEKLWPESAPLSRRANMRNLCCGRTDTIKYQWIKTICEMTGCDANFLFDIKTNEQ